MERFGLDAHRSGTAMLAFGVVGLLLAAVVAVGLVAGALRIGSLQTNLEDDRQAAVEGLEAVSASLGHAAVGVTNLGATLETTQTALEDMSSTLGSFADTTDSLANGLGFSVLGQQPLLGAAQGFRDLSGQLRTFSATTGQLAVDLARNQGDLVATTADLEELQRQVDKLTARLQSAEGIGPLVTFLAWGIVLLAALVAWIAAAAALVAWLGWRLRRPVPVVTTPLGPGTAPPSGTT
jgi:hypothetical protein